MFDRWRAWKPAWTAADKSNWKLALEVVLLISILTGFSAIAYHAHNTAETVPDVDDDGDLEEQRLEINVHDLIDSARVAKNLGITAFTLYCLYFLLNTLVSRVLKLDR
jgi:hypothetical protein